MPKEKKKQNKTEYVSGTRAEQSVLLNSTGHLRTDVLTRPLKTKLQTNYAGHCFSIHVIYIGNLILQTQNAEIQNCALKLQFF